MVKKQTITAQELCEGLPTGFQDLSQYIRDLKHNVEPDYDHIKSLILKIASDECIMVDEDEANHKFEWDFKPG